MSTSSTGGAGEVKKATAKKKPAKRKVEVMTPVVNEEEEEINRAAGMAGINVKDSAKIKKQRVQKTSEIVQKFTGAQFDRYEAYRRSKLPQASVKRLVQAAGGGQVNDTCGMVMSGITKVFVGEVIEAARQVEEEWGDTGPLQPAHIREAYRRLRNAGSLPYHATNKLPIRQRRF